MSSKMFPSLPNIAKVASLVLPICSFQFARADASFKEVRAVIFEDSLKTGSEIENDERSVYDHGKLPQYSVSASHFFSEGVNLLTKAAKRTINDSADYLPRLEKLLHPNGICFTGEWKITSNTPYSGMFASKAVAPIIVRASTALSETQACEGPRAFGFAGKIFPTTNLEAPVKTLNFFTIDTLGGRDSKYFTTQVLTNEPETGDLRFDLISLGFNVLTAFKTADKNPGFRPIDHLAATGVDNVVKKIRSPKWMMIRYAPNQKINDEQDFRDELALEVLQHHVFEVLVNEKTGDRDSKDGWVKVGEIDLNESIVSYGCDRQLTFQHPKSK